MIGVNLNNKTYYLYEKDGLLNGLPLVVLDEARLKKTKEEKKKEEEYNSFELSDIDSQTISQFELLWSKYPKKVGKKEALYYYNRAIKKGESFNIIEQGLDNYIDYLNNDGTPDIHIKYGFNWFKNECWNDEYETNNHYFDDIF